MLEKEEVYQYYHRVPACQAASAEAQDCICWHDEGTGIYAGVNRRNPSRSLSWRIKPEGKVCNLYQAKVDILKIVDSNSKEVIKITSEGRIFWRQREVETDEEFRAAILEMLKRFLEVKTLSL